VRKAKAQVSNTDHLIRHLNNSLQMKISIISQNKNNKNILVNLINWIQVLENLQEIQ
jgi:hypothetical protein